MSTASPSTPGQAPEGGQPQVGTPTTPVVTPAPGAPLSPQAGAGQPAQPKFAFNSPEEVEEFANRLINERRRANRGEQEAKGELSELKQQVQYLVTQQQLDRQRAISANVQLQAKTLGFRNPELIYGAIMGKLQYDQTTGQPINTQAVLETLKTSDPYLLEVPPAAGQPPAAQPGQPQLPGQVQAPIGQAILPPPSQPRMPGMNAPQSAVTTGSGLTWETIQANIRNPTWVAANMAAIEEFQANPANHQNRQR